MDSKEIRQRDPVARTSWSSMEGIGEQIYELTLQVREIAARMAEQAESTPAPEAASAAHPSDAVTQDIVMACCESYNNHDLWIPQGPRIESVLRTFAEALLEGSDKTCKVLYSDERSLVNRVLTKAISNLLPEVKS